MPNRNYQFEKRQKDLAKKQKREEKQQRKRERSSEGQPETEGTTPSPDGADEMLLTPPATSPSLEQEKEPTA